MKRISQLAKVNVKCKSSVREEGGDQEKTDHRNSIVATLESIAILGIKAAQEQRNVTLIPSIIQSY